MLKFFWYSIICFCIAFPQFCWADDGEEDSDNSDEVVVDNTTLKPKSGFDGAVNLKCKYRLGSFIFKFETPEGTAKARVTNLSNGKTYSRSFPTFFEYSLTVGNEEGSYEIFVETSRGSKYIGYYTIVTH